MPVRRYSHEQLLNLRSSPLVKKPDNLPPIEQWIDEASHPQAQQDKVTGRINTRQPRTAVGGDASPMGNFSTGQRPSLLQTRTTGPRSDDVVLGPPKSTFASSRSITRLTSFNDATDQSLDELDISRTRPYSDRQHQRKNTNTNEKDLRGERESWTATRDRRAMGDSEHTRADSTADRDMRAGRRTNDRQQDTRWDKKPNGDRQGGWRDVDTTRRPWERTEATERDPEWFDEPVTNKAFEDDFASTGPARTQEDFQKWKAMMASSNKDNNNDTKEITSSATTTKPREVLKLDGVIDTPLAGFGIKSPEPAEQPLAKQPPKSNAKASRFASMFKKEEAPAELPHLPEPQPQTSITMNTINTEDQEGFKRILSMLGGAKIGAAEPTPPTAEPRSPVKTSANGTRQRSRFFDATPRSPEEARPPLPLDDTQHQRTQTVELPAEQLPKGGTSTPENNIQNLLASQRAQRQTAPTNKDTAFLLGLLQGRSSRPPSQGTRPDSDFPLWVSPPPEPHAPKPRMAPPPPGHIDESLLRNAPPQVQNGINAQRPPPGFDEQSMFMQQQFQPILQQAQFDQNRRLPQANMIPPGMPPPPGFPMNMRQPVNNFMGAQPSQPVPGFPPGMAPFQGPGAPPGFGRGMVPNGPPPGFNGAATAGRGYEHMYDPRR